MDDPGSEVWFQLVKRDGRREQYDRTKLARSLSRAGVAPYMLGGILSIIAPNPDQDTGSLRASIESELKGWQPTAARRYGKTRRLYAYGSIAVARGSVGWHPETTGRLGVKSGDTVWLGENGVWVSLSVETTTQVEPGHARLNDADLADLGSTPGARLLATGVCPVPLRHDGSCMPVDRHHALALASPQ